MSRRSLTVLTDISLITCIVQKGLHMKGVSGLL